MSQFSPGGGRLSADAGVSTREFDQFMRRFDDLREQIASGFEGVHDRQDKTNGRIDSVETLVHTINTEGCAVNRCGGEPVRRWHEHPATKAASGGLGAGVGLGIVYEALRTLGHFLGVK